MEKGTIFVTLIFLAIIALPFVLTGYSRKKRKNGLFSQLSQLAGNDQGAISQHEFCSNFVIGLDEATNHLYFYKEANDRKLAKQVDLNSFRSCRLLTTSRTVGEGKERLLVIDKLELCFYPHDKSGPVEVVEVYNTEYDSLTLTGELQLAEKWETLLNERLRTLRKTA